MELGPPPSTFQEEAGKVENLVGQSSEEWELAWEGIGTHSTMPQILCSALERETFPSLLPGHTHVPLFPPSGGARNTVSPSKEPDLPPQRLASWSAGLGF